MRKGWVWIAALALAPLPALFGPAAPVSADILMPGQRSVSYCFEIANISEYPDYAFIVHFAEPIGGHQMIEQGKCVRFYKLARPVIYAVPKAGFTSSEIPDGGREKAAEKNYFDTNPKLLKSSIQIVSLSTVDEKDPRSEATDVLRITGMSGRTLNIEKDSIRYVYTNGSSETLPYATQDTRPEPKNIAAPWYAYWYLGLPVVALSGIAAVFFGRRRKR